MELSKFLQQARTIHSNIPMSLLSLLPSPRSRFRQIRLGEFHYRTSTTVKLVPRDFANYGNQGGSGKSRGYSRFLLSRVLLVFPSHAQLLDEATSSNCISNLIGNSRNQSVDDSTEVRVEFARRDFVRGTCGHFLDAAYKGMVKGFRQEQM